MQQLFLSLIFMVLSAHAADIAITIDDFSIHDGPKLNLEARDENILKALAKNKIKAGLFVRCASLDDARILKRLDAWDKAGHLIGNHTFSHWNFNRTEFSKYAEDFKKCDERLKNLKHFAKLFRFPYLKGGDTAEKRDQMQALLKENGYRNGYVTIDASDWFIADTLEAKLKANPKLDVTPYRDYYLAHMWDRAQYYDDLAQKYWKKPVHHTILMHHNLLNSLFLGDLVEMFKKKGWHLVDAQVAFQDPIFDELPNVLPAGESIVWSVAKMAGDKTLRMPGEDSVYEEENMKKAGLL